jgi:hypothetical protein
MTAPLSGWLFLGPLIRFLQLLANVRLSRRRRRRRGSRYSHWKGFGIERTRFESFEDSQS